MRSERLWGASLAVLAAKLAVLAAMLAVLDGKLAAQGGPNGVRSRPRALFERVRKLHRRRERTEDDFSSFCLVARKLRCASRYSFYKVLLLLDEVSTEHASAAKTS